MSLQKKILEAPAEGDDEQMGEGLVFFWGGGRGRTHDTDTLWGCQWHLWAVEVKQLGRRLCPRPWKWPAWRSYSFSREAQKSFKRRCLRLAALLWILEGFICCWAAVAVLCTALSRSATALCVSDF